MILYVPVTPETCRVVRAIAYMESMVKPRDWNDLPSGRAPIFRDLRSEKGERMILEENAFIEILLPKHEIGSAFARFIRQTSAAT